MAEQAADFENEYYQQLKHGIYRRLKAEKIEDQIFRVVQQAYDELLEAENIVLSREERKRLLRDILIEELGEMLAALKN